MNKTNKLTLCNLSRTAARLLRETNFDFWSPMRHKEFTVKVYYIPGHACVLSWQSLQEMEELAGKVVSCSAGGWLYFYSKWVSYRGSRVHHMLNSGGEFFDEYFADDPDACKRFEEILRSLQGSSSHNHRFFSERLRFGGKLYSWPA